MSVICMVVYGRLQHLPKTWSGPLWDGPYGPQKCSGAEPKIREEIDASDWWFICISNVR